MKLLIFVLVIFIEVNIFSQSVSRDDDSINWKWSVQYDTSVLRIPGNDLPIGISEKLKNGKIEQTSGLLKGKVNWNKFKIEVEGGTFHRGEIQIAEADGYLKDKAIIVKVYDKKSSKLLFTQQIPYNYETRVRFLANTNFEKVPGSIVKYGFRTFYDNGTYVDLWPTKPKFRFNFFRVDSSEILHLNKLDKPLDQFFISADGGYFLKRYLVIENDPFKIKNHTASFMVALIKNPKIADTIETKLNYIANYTFDSQFVRNYCMSNEDHDPKNQPVIYFSGNQGDRGHDLEVFADVYYDNQINDTIIKLAITDLNNCEQYNYLVNTKGGTIKIYSHGLSGSNGSDGSSGSDGSNGSDGSSGSSGSITTKTITNSDGSTSTVTEEGPGGNGSDGGSGGNGGMGGNGSNGGDGGDGGDIYFNYTPAVQNYLHLMDIRSVPGIGGSGGKGGSGGRGGRGGRGGSGGSGSPSGSSGSDGSNGSDGSSGFDGSSGNSGREGKVILNLIR